MNKGYIKNIYKIFFLIFVLFISSCKKQKDVLHDGFKDDLFKTLRANKYQIVAISPINFQRNEIPFAVRRKLSDDRSSINALTSFETYADQIIVRDQFIIRVYVFKRKVVYINLYSTEWNKKKRKKLLDIIRKKYPDIYIDDTSITIKKEKEILDNI
jgi:hypothetical protein